MAGIPQVITSDRATGAQVIDGSLGFSGTDQKLERTPGSAGNQQTWTWSGWIKLHKSNQEHSIFSSHTGSSDRLHFRISSGQIQFAQNTGSWDFDIRSNALLRDIGWYHIVAIADFTNSTQNDRARLYVNGERQTLATNTLPSNTTTDTIVNAVKAHYIGEARSSTDYYGRMSQVYLIDGQALGPEYFGFTDPLTNTWKPKKFRRGVFEELDKFNTYTWAESQNQLRYQGIKFPSSAGGTVAWKATGSSNTGLNLYTSTDNSTWTRRLTNQTVDSTNGLVYESSDQYVILVNGTDTNWSNQLQLFSDVNGATIHYSNSTYPGNGSPTMSWSGPGYTDGTIASYNSFYLPFDGNSPIGQDKSGNGNDWTPVNFGGSNSLEKATGAKPILNTTPGGNSAAVGVFGSKQNVGYAVTVYDDGGGNKYYIDGVKQDTVTGLIRGATYTFDTSDSTVSSHPFRFSATSNGSHGGGSEYTNGVAAITGAATTITVPHDAPNTLYYYCTSHSGMGADITGITTNEKLADQYASNCVIALPLVSITDDKSNSVNIGTTAKTVSQTGSSSDIAASTEKSNFYASSAKFNGNVARLEISGGGGTDGDYDFGTGDFTMECWFYPTATVNTNNRLFCSRGDRNNYQLMIGSNKYLQFDISGTSYTSANNVFGLNKWHHFAATRQSGTLRLFVNGVIVKEQASVTADLDETTGIDIGYESGYSSYINGYMQDARVYKGVAKYTSNFVPAATSPDILPDTPSGVSGSSKLTKITDGAVSFDGSGDYLDVPESSGEFDFGTGDFTVEFFANANSYGNDMLGTANNSTFLGSSKSGWIVRNNANLWYFSYQSNNSWIFETTFTTTAVAKRWHHVAFTRSGTDLKCFMDGIQQGSTSTNSTNLISTENSLRIGGGTGSTSNLYNGFLSNVRVIKGTALYTSNFTPPTAPLTNVTNTKLLCCQSNANAGAAAVSPNISGINDGTVWSSGAGANFEASRPATVGFDGDISTFTRTDNASVTATVTLPKSVAFTTLKVRGARDSGNGTITINGVDVSSQFTSSSSTLETVTITGVTSPLTSIALTGISGSAQPRFSAIYVDDVILVDPLTPNGDAAATNFNPFTTDINTVRGQETGYATWNPLTNRGVVTTSDGNLTANAINSGYGYTLSTIAVSSGKYYCEISFEGTMAHSVNYNYIGIVPTDSAAIYTGQDIFRANGALSIDSNSSVIRGTIGTGSGETNNTYQSSYGFDENDTIGIAIDCDTPQVTFYKNGTSIGTFPHTMQSNKSWVLFVNDWANAADFTGYILNAGQKPFKFPPPDGFQPPNAANVRPETVISRPDQYVGVTTYTGNNTVGRIIDIGRNADLVWVKKRTAENHILVDTVRGENNFLMSDSTNAANTSGGPITGIGATVYNGFIVDNNGYVNASDAAYVCWNWKAGGDKNTFNVDDVGYASAAAAGLTAGDVAPTGASVGTKQGFSIIRWTAPTWNGSPQQVPHGLTQSPSFIIAKVINDTASWVCYHKDLDASNPQNKYLTLNSNGAVSTLANGWGTSAPNSTTFGDRQLGWSDGKNVISYIWHDVPGLQKFGTYEGNGNVDGPYVELGFTPAILMLKNYDDTEHWYVYDPERSPHNVAYQSLQWSSTGAEETGTTNTRVDLLSNGFKLRQANGPNNSNSYIYAAWAAAPSVDLFGGGANAR